MKVLFIHNTIAEYRISFFLELSKLVDLDILVTDRKLASSIYGLKTDIPKALKILYVNKEVDIIDILNCGTYDLVVLPPVDNFYQMKCAYIALKKCKKNGVRTVYWTEKWEAEKSLQPMIKRIKNFLQSRIISYFAKKVDLCIAAGARSKQYYIDNNIPCGKIKIAIDSSSSPCCNEKIDIRKKYGINKNAKIILFLGRLIKRKGCDILIQAFDILCKKEENIYLLICGDGEDSARLHAFVNDKHIKNVIFAGKIQPLNRAEYFSQSDVFVLPSITLNGIIEAWGLTVNEALEQGTPVVATTAVGSIYDLADGKCCVAVKEDFKELAIAIHTILENQQLSEICKSRYRQFNVQNMARQFYLAFKSVKIKE